MVRNFNEETYSNIWWELNSTSFAIKTHCVKSVQIWSFFWSECVKIRTRKNSVFGQFSRSDILSIALFFHIILNTSICKANQRQIKESEMPIRFFLFIEFTSRHTSKYIIWLTFARNASRESKV